MTTGDYATMGRLGTRTALDPRVPASLLRMVAVPAPRRRGRRHRGADPISTTVQLVDYSVSGISFTGTADLALQAGDVCVVRLGDAESRVRVIGSHPVDADTVWGAMFLDPQPDLVRAVEEQALHRNVAAEEAAWNARRD